MDDRMLQTDIENVQQSEWSEFGWWAWRLRVIDNG